MFSWTDDTPEYDGAFIFCEELYNREIKILMSMFCFVVHISCTQIRRHHIHKQCHKYEQCHAYGQSGSLHVPSIATFCHTETH